VSLNIYNTKGKIQNNICDKLGSIHIGSYAFWSKQWTTNLPKSYEQWFQGIFRQFKKNSFLDNFIVYKDMDNHLFKLKLCFEKCKQFKINLN
jgi:hypothetical protein